MTTEREERRERANRLCRELSRQIAMVASPGLGHWDEAWRIVEEPSRRFLDVLGEWEVSGDDDTKHRAKVAAGKVLDAWKEADALYRALGPRVEIPALRKFSTAR